MVSFYIQRDFQRHLTRLNPSQNEEVMTSTSWRKKKAAEQKTVTKFLDYVATKPKESQKICHDKFLLCYDKDRRKLFHNKVVGRDIEKSKAKTNFVAT